MKAKFAGHSAVFLYDSDFVCAIDPWLEGNPLCPENLKIPPRIDLIVLTHGHSDHASDAVRLQKLTGAKIAATFELAIIMIQEGVAGDAVIPMNKGGTVEFGRFQVTLTHAFHSSSYDSPARGTLYAGEPCGAVLTNGETCVFHAGDTALFADLELIGKRHRPTAAFLPMGDRFTMGAEEAADAARLLRVKTAFPIHYKTFPILAQSADGFIAACRSLGIDAIEMPVGEEIRIP